MTLIDTLSLDNRRRTQDLPVSASQPLTTPESLNQPPTWQQLLKTQIRTPEALWQYLKLSEEQLPQARLAAKKFPLRVPRGFADKINAQDPYDPILRQILPLESELDVAPGYSHDPLGEAEATPLPGLIHKYHGRVLLITSTQCAINCRYCFRREFPYEDNRLSKAQWAPVFDYITHDESISEVILSGGDPLSLSNTALQWFVNQCESIPHVQRLRIHSRLPVVLPERIDVGLVDLLKNSRLQKVMVIHSNHANEIDGTLGKALQPLKKIGITLLNQTVLLKGINDKASTLAELSDALFNIDVLPYYLHLLDRVNGAHHFEVDRSTAQEIYNELLALRSGYLIPKFVQEIAGERNKTPIL